MEQKNAYIKSSMLIIVLMVLSFGSVWGQSSPQIAKGDKYFFNQEYDEAISMYTLAYQMDESAESSRKLAETYKRIGQMEECANWLKITIEADDKTPEDILKYAEILKIMEKYPEAIAQYKAYSELKPEDQRAQEHIRNEYYYKDLWEDSLKYRMHLLGINSEMESFGVVPFEEDKYMFSASMVNDDYCLEPDKKKDYFLDIYQCKLNKDEQFVDAQRFDKPVNSKYHDGPIFYDKNSKTIYITRNNMKGNRPVKNKNGDIILKIYTTKFIDEQWQEVEELSLNSDEYSTGHPCLSADGQILYFISNKPGGYGGTDIYKSYWKNDHWGEPINLGPNVNTEGNEMFPYVSKEGIIYFASDGHAGLGGLDNFMCEPWGSNWSVAYNLGAPINTNFDDFSLLFVPGEEIGFFTSNRSGKGFGDIYFFKQIEILEQQLTGKLIVQNDEVSLKDQKVRVLFVNTKEEVEIPLDELDKFTFTIHLNQKVEFYMADTTLFMSDKLVAYNAPEKFHDPAVDLGTFVIKTRKQIEEEQLASKNQEIIQDLNSRMETLASNTDQITKENLAEIEASIKNLESLEDDGLIDQLIALKEQLSYLENLIYEKEYVVYDDTEMVILKKEVDNLNIDNIYFGFDSYVITAKASVILDSVYYHMEKNTTWKIEIDTHTDSQGSAAYNKYLSQERANSVRRYLKYKGISEDRILLRWHGENDLLTVEKTEDDYRKNRRAEFRYMVVSNRSEKEKTGYIEGK